MPEEVRDRVIASRHDIFDDSDACTRDIYDIGNRAASVVSADIARACVDLNRAVDDRPPENPDGVVKTKTCLGRPIYAPGRELDRSLADRLIDSYYRPFHRRIRSALQDPGIEIALDCHSMSPTGPAISPDPGQTRSMFCLGDVQGRSCDPATTRRLAECLRSTFDLKHDDITINRPFSGGHITRTYGRNPVAWIQVEMNRVFYLAESWFDRTELAVAPERLRELRDRFALALEKFFGELARP